MDSHDGIRIIHAAEDFDPPSATAPREDTRPSLRAVL